MNDETYLTSTMIHDQKIMPADTFAISGNEYVLLDILVDQAASSPLLKIMGMNNEHAGIVVVIPVEQFELMQKDDFRNFINGYQTENHA